MPFWNKEREEAPAPREGAAAPTEPHKPPAQPVREESTPMAMLKREDAPTSIPANNELNALLGKGSEFEGKLTFEGTVRIDGKFTGSVNTNDVLVVGEGAKLNAEVTCGTVIVHGEVNGNIKAKNAIELHHPAKVRGNVETPSLMIEKGVIFEGQAKMEALEKAASAAAPKPAPAPVASVPAPSPAGKA